MGRPGRAFGQELHHGERGRLRATRVTSASSEEQADPTGQVDFADENPLYRFLERNLFPRIVGYTIHPLHILILLILWIGLLFWHNTIFELVGGNYTNGLSA